MGKEKASIQGADRKMEMKKKAAKDTEKQAEHLLKQSRAAQNKAAGFAANAKAAERSKVVAQNALIQATKDGAQAKELSTKANTQANQAQQKVAPPLTASKLEKETVHINTMIDGQVENAKEKQKIAKETVAKAQAQAKEAEKEAVRARNLAEERVKYQVRKAESAVCSSKQAVAQASSALSEDPTQPNIQAMKQ